MRTLPRPYRLCDDWRLESGQLDDEIAVLLSLSPIDLHRLREQVLDGDTVPGRDMAASMQIVTDADQARYQRAWEDEQDDDTRRGTEQMAAVIVAPIVLMALFVIVLSILL